MKNAAAWIMAVQIALLLLCLSASQASEECFSSGDIECTCVENSIACTGVQMEFSEIETMFSNLSSKDALDITLNITNLTFPSDYRLDAFHLVNNLSIVNGLQNLQDGLFSDLGPALIILSLRKNGLSSFNQPFSSLHNLLELDLDFNDLNAINSDVFLNLRSLEILKISGNGLNELERDFLKNLPVIQKLFLNSNNLSSINDIDVESFTLEELIAQKCSINGSLKADSLSGLPNLKNADFSHNLLIGVESYALSRLRDLKSLDLSENMLQSLEEHAFSSLTSLKSLNLRNNRISFIRQKSFLNLTSLIELDLSGNLLEAFVREYTVDLFVLERINLEENRIKIIDTGTFSYSNNLQELLLAGNDLDCSCELSYIAAYISNSSMIKSDDIICSSPPTEKGMKLVAVDFKSMNCELDDPTPKEDEYDYDDDEDDDDKPVSSSTTLITVSSTEVQVSSTEITSTAVQFSSTETVNSTTLSSTIIENDITLPSNETTVSTDNSAAETATQVLGSFSNNDSTEIISTTTGSTMSIIAEEDNNTLSTSNSTSIIMSTVDIITENTILGSYLPLSQSSTVVASNTTTITTPMSKDHYFDSTTSSETPAPTMASVSNSSLSELTINILDSYFSNGTLCIKWSISGRGPNKPLCILQMRTRVGKKSKHLICPIGVPATEKCLPGDVVYYYCLEVRGIPSSKVCNDLKPEVPSTENTSLYKTTEIHIDTDSTNSSLLTSRSITVASTNPTTFTTPMSKDHYFDSTGSSETPTMGSASNPSSLGTTTELRIVPTSIKISTRMTTVPPTISEDRTTLKINFVERTSTEPWTEFDYNYAVSGSRTRDDGYKNYSLIAMICLLVVVIIIIVVILVRTLLKKRTESVRYNVSEEEKNIVKRRSSTRTREPCVRYSYTRKEEV